MATATSDELLTLDVEEFEILGFVVEGFPDEIVGEGETLGEILHISVDTADNVDVDDDEDNERRLSFSSPFDVLSSPSESSASSSEDLLVKTV